MYHYCLLLSTPNCGTPITANFGPLLQMAAHSGNPLLNFGESLSQQSDLLQRSLQKHFWSDKMNLEQKMRKYKLFKSSLVKEDYLIIKSEVGKLRRAMTISFSAHRLANELGRYNKPPLPPEKKNLYHMSQQTNRR